MRMSRFAIAAAFALALAAPAARAADPDPLLPADADTVAYVNIKQLVGSEVVKKFALEQIKQAMAGQDAKKILDEMGLDPLKDIDTLWVGSSGKDQADMKALFVIHGKFDPEKLLKTAEAASKKDGDKFSIIKDGNATLFKYQPEQGNPVYGTVVNDTTLVGGSDKKIIAAALKQTQAKKAAISADLAALVKKMDEKSSMFAVSVVKGKFENVKLPAGQFGLDFTAFEKALPKTDSLSMIVKVTGDINLEVVFGMKDADAATDMGDAVAKLLEGIKGLVPLLAAAEPKAKPLTDVVKTFKSDVKQKDVTVTGKVTGENLGKMVNPAQ